MILLSLWSGCFLSTWAFTIAGKEKKKNNTQTKQNKPLNTTLQKGISSSNLLYISSTVSKFIDTESFLMRDDNIVSQFKSAKHLAVLVTNAA